MNSNYEIYQVQEGDILDVDRARYDGYLFAQEELKKDLFNTIQELTDKDNDGNK